MMSLRRHRLRTALRYLAATIVAWLVFAIIVVKLTDAIGDGRVW